MFLWSAADGMVDVATLIDPADPNRALFDESMYVSDINDSGQIAATAVVTGGSKPRAVVLVPSTTAAAAR